MPDTDTTLVLEPSGEDQGCAPNYEPWTPAVADHHPRKVAIYNASGYEQTLSDITPGLLNPTSPGPGHQITLAPGSTWTGTVGNDNGEYTYQGGLAAQVPRTGTINPT